MPCGVEPNEAEPAVSATRCQDAAIGGNRQAVQIEPRRTTITGRGAVGERPEEHRHLAMEAACEPPTGVRGGKGWIAHRCRAKMINRAGETPGPERIGSAAQFDGGIEMLPLDAGPFDLGHLSGAVPQAPSGDQCHDDGSDRERRGGRPTADESPPALQRRDRPGHCGEAEQIAGQVACQFGRRGITLDRALRQALRSHGHQIGRHPPQRPIGLEWVPEKNHPQRL